MSPLVIVDNKNRKWRICVYYKELSVAKKRIIFYSLSLIMYLKLWLVKHIFHFLKDIVATIKFRLHQRTRKKSHSHAHGEHFLYFILPIGLYNTPATFQREVLSIFSNLTKDYMELYMDDFIVHVSTFDEAMMNLD